MLEQIKIDKYVVNGCAGEYIFETIKQNQDFYEAPLLKKWLPYVQESRVILDIGANIGNYSLFWTLHTKAKAIYSFEPLREYYALLYKNIEDNHLDCTIHSIYAAVGDKNSLTELGSLDIMNIGSATFEKTKESQAEIPLFKIDSFIMEHNIPCVDFVKIDTKGFEISILGGMKEVISRDHPMLWIVVSGKTEKEVRDILQSNGYKIVDLVGANYFAVHPIKNMTIREADLDEILSQYFEHFEKRANYFKLYNEVRDRERDMMLSFQKLQAVKKEQAEQLKHINKEYQLLLGEVEEIRPEKLQMEKSFQLLFENFETLKIEKAVTEKKLLMLSEEFNKIESEKASLSASLASIQAVEEKVKQMFYKMETDLSIQDGRIDQFQNQIVIYENSFKQQIKLILKNIVSRLRKLGIRHPVMGKIMQKIYRKLKKGYDTLFKTF